MDEKLKAEREKSHNLGIALKHKIERCEWMMKEMETIAVLADCIKANILHPDPERIPAHHRAAVAIAEKVHGMVHHASMILESEAK